MQYNIYSIKDELANTFGNLMVLHPVTASRSFKWMTQEMEKADCDDKRIYQVGTFDNETGMIQAMTPVMIYNIEEEKKHNGENFPTV